MMVRTRAHIMYLAEFSFNMVALLFASMKSSVISLMSDLTIFVRPQILAFIDPGVRSWNKVVVTQVVFMSLQASQVIPEQHI